MKNNRKRSGIYFLFKGKRLIYIGQSINVHLRIYEHLRVDYTSVRIIDCDPEKLIEYEKRLIAYFNPLCNKVHKTSLEYSPLPYFKEIHYKANEYLR